MRHQTLGTFALIVLIAMTAATLTSAIAAPESRPEKASVWAAISSQIKGLLDFPIGLLSGTDRPLEPVPIARAKAVPVDSDVPERAEPDDPRNELGVTADPEG